MRVFENGIAGSYRDCEVIHFLHEGSCGIAGFFLHFQYFCADVVGDGGGCPVVGGQESEMECIAKGEDIAGDELGLTALGDEGDELRDLDEVGIVIDAG